MTHIAKIYFFYFCYIYNQSVSSGAIFVEPTLFAKTTDNCNVPENDYPVYVNSVENVKHKYLKVKDVYLFWL